MKLSSLIDPRNVLVGETFATLDEAAARALKHAEVHYRDSVAYPAALAAIRARAALGATVLPGGVAIPHARIQDYGDLLILPVVPKEGIAPETGAERTRLAWVVLLGSGSSGLYLKCLAAFAKIAGDAALSGALSSAASGQDFVALLERSGLEVEKEAHVEDVMTAPAVTIGTDATVKELLDLMAAKSLRYVPVLDGSGHLVGEIGVLDVIDAAIPDYARRMGSLKFLDELEPMEEFLRRESTMKVSAIMKKPAGVFAPGDSLVAVSVAMSKQRKRHFPVCDGERVVGVLSSMDILFKVLRA